MERFPKRTAALDFSTCSSRSIIMRKQRKSSYLRLLQGRSFMISRTFFCSSIQITKAGLTSKFGRLSQCQLPFETLVWFTKRIA
ncbi:hypothetical protein CSUI_000044, partial [Cystoisospora suis]